jgi:2-(1,2-epoxy-1,2-dihydrophenyl)acetyl-CoA isomerase
MTQKLLVEATSAVCRLIINRPRIRNAVDAETMDALRAALLAAEDDPTTRVIVITGAGGAFSSGADLTAAAGLVDVDVALRTLTDSYHPTLKAIRACRWPVIAAVDGVAAGIGLDLALACDMRLASDRASFAELFIRVGLIPDGGGTWSLPRLVGLGRAMEMVMTGDAVSAEEAVRIGLANKLYPATEFEASVAQFAERLSRQAPLALTRAKRALLAAQDGSYEEAMSREAAFQREIFMSDDGFEGFRAFLEKRPPQWKGR